MQPILNDLGFFARFDDWSLEQAIALAEGNGLTLTQEHIEIVWLLREFYQHYQRSPNMRLFVKAVQAQYPSRANSQYLMQKFGESPAREACRYAGLPKPKNCL